MNEYLKQYIIIVIDSAGDGKTRPVHPIDQNHGILDIASCFRQIASELDRLDPRDFEPAVQMDFLRIRGNVAYLTVGNPTLAKPLVEKTLSPLLPVLDQFRGPGSGGVTRQFSFVNNADLRSIIERDYIELSLILFPGGAWKSSVIMAGSILEAILFSVLSDPKRLAATNASPKGAKARGGVAIDIAVDPGSWKLTHLIEVAVDISVLPSARADTIDQVLRDYRNFVHPQKELKAKHECTEAEAGLAKYGLDGVCDHLEKTL